MLISSFEEKYEFLDLKQKIEESGTKLNEGREDVKLHVKPSSLLLNLNRRIEEVVQNSLRSSTNSGSWINLFLGLLANKH